MILIFKCLFGQIWKKPSLCVMDTRNIREHPERCSVIYISGNAVYADILKIWAVRLCSDPALTEEHGSLFASCMYHVHQFFCTAGYESLDKMSVIPVSLGRHTESRVEVSVIDQIFRLQGISVFLLESFQRLCGNRSAIAEPVRILFVCFFVENQNIMIEERSKTHNICMRMFAEPFLQTFFGISC